MTDEERFDLQRETIARCRASGRQISPEGRQGLIAGAAKGSRIAIARHRARVRLAARYASLWNVTLTEAAKEFEVSRSSVAEIWRELYPGRPQPRKP